MKTHSEQRRDELLVAAANAVLPEAGLAECMALADQWCSAPDLLRQRDALLAACRGIAGIGDDWLEEPGPRLVDALRLARAAIAACEKESAP